MNYSRRNFIKTSSALSALGFMSTSALSKSVTGAVPFQKPDIVVAEGKEYFSMTRKAVEKLGVLKKAMNKGSKVGLLVNSDFELEGAYVNPDIVLATIQSCLDYGAEEFVCIQNIKEEFWKRSPYYDDYKDLISSFINIEANTFPSKYNENDFVKMETIDGAKSLVNAEIVKALFECDVLINIPIAKHHSLTQYTGALKNMMGVCTRDTNVYYHLGGPEKNDPDFLGQCIADINMVRQPDLIVADATSFIITGGPVGPGEIKQADKIVAGTDLVAVDALCCTYLDLIPEDINMIKLSAESGLGEIDYTKLNIDELKV